MPIGFLSSAARKVTVLFTASCGVLITLTDAVNLAARAAAPQSYTVEDAKIARAAEQLSTRAVVASAYLRLDYVLKDWPAEGVEVDVAALYGGSRLEPLEGDLVETPVNNLALETSAIAGVKEFYVAIPAITVDDETALVCIAQKIWPSLPIWEGTVFAAIPDRGEWTERSGKDMEAYLSHPASRGLLRAIQPGNDILSLSLTEAKLITLDRFTSVEQGPCSETRLMDFRQFQSL